MTIQHHQRKKRRPQIVHDGSGLFKALSDCDDLAMYSSLFIHQSPYLVYLIHRFIFLKSVTSRNQDRLLSGIKSSHSHQLIDSSKCHPSSSSNPYPPSQSPPSSHPSHSSASSPPPTPSSTPTANTSSSTHSPSPACHPQQSDAFGKNAFHLDLCL
jgi:hypothetical protein